MAQGVASAQGLSDLASDIIGAINSDVFWSQAADAIAAAPDQAALADAITADMFSSEAYVALPELTEEFQTADGIAAETFTAYALPERIPVEVFTLAAPAARVLAAAPVAPVATAPAAPVVTTATATSVPARLTVSLNELSTINAGAEPINILDTDQIVTGLSSNNTINVGGNMISGAVSFNANALSNFAGIGNFVINTGDNNVVQGTLSVQVLSAPPNIVIGP